MVKIFIGFYVRNIQNFIRKFLEDKAALLPLPAVRFDTSSYGNVTSDKYGRFTLDKGKYRCGQPCNGG